MAQEPTNSFALEVTGESSAKTLRRVLNQVSLNGGIRRFSIKIESDEPIQAPVNEETAMEEGEDGEVGEVEEEEGEGEEDVFICGECGEQFTSPQALGGHQRKHNYEEARQEAEEEAEERREAFREEGVEEVVAAETNKIEVEADAPPISEENIPDINEGSRAYTVLSTLVDRDQWLKTPKVREMTPTPNDVPDSAYATVLYQLYDRGLADRRKQKHNENRYEYRATVKGKAALFKADERLDELQPA